MMEHKRQDMDNFFRENISDFELSEKKGNWELLNHLLNEQDRKKKRRRWFLFILCFMVILSSGLFVLLPGKKMNQNTNTKTESSSTSAGTENNLLKNKRGKSTATIPADKNEIVKDTGHDVEKKESGNNSSTHDETDNLHNSVMNKGANHKGIKTVDEHSGVIKSETNFIPPQSNILLNDSDKNVINETKNSESFVVNYPNGNDSVTTNTIAQETAAQNSISFDSIVIKPGGNDSLTAIAKDNSPADSAMTKKLTSANTRFLNFNFYAGLNVYNTSSRFINQQHFSPVIGLEVLHPLSSKFTVGLAGLYSLQRGYHLNDTLREEAYFLDKNVSQQTIQIHQLHKLYFPLTLYYTLAQRHSVLCVIEASYLITTNGNYTEMNTTSGVTNESQKNNVKGYMDGIKSTNISFSLGYKFSLTKRFDLSTRFSQELTESYSKEYFYGVNTKPSWSLQAFLTVKL